MKKILLTTLALCFILPQFAKADILTGLVDLYKLDEGSGSTAIDSGSGGNDMTEVNSPTYVTGKIGPFALSLASASSQSASKTSPSGLNIQDNTPSSFSAWVKTTDGSTDVISSTWNLSTDAGYRFSVGASSGGDVELVYINAAGNSYRQVYTAGALVNDGQWHNVVATYDGSASAAGMSIYIDGSKKTTTTGSNTAPGTLGNATLFMGKIGGGIPQFFNGTLDDVRIYNRTLSSSDITELYAFPPSSASPPFYKFFVSLGSAFMVTLGSVFQIQ